MRTFGRLGVIVVALLLVVSCGTAVPTVAPAKPAAPAAPTRPDAQPAITVAPAAASTTAAAAPKPTAASIAKIKRGGTLIRLDFRDATSWDPAFSTNSSEVAESPALECLLRWEMVDEKTGKHEAKPWLAESWQPADPKTIIIKLRKGIKYHDGTEMNAESVKWALDRARTHAKSLAKAFQAPVDSIDVVDASTIKLNLKGPSATIFVNLTNAAGGTGSTGTLLTSKAAFDKLGEEAITRRPTGTGPFVLDDWKRDDRTTYKKFDGYWKQGDDGQKLPYLDGIEVRVMRDRAVGLIELKTGKAHVMMRADAKDIAGIKANPELKFLSMPWASLRTLFGFNSEKTPFGNNVKLRQAALYALDLDALARTIGLEYGIPGYYTFWVPGWLGYDETLPKYQINLDKSKALLKEAGYPDGTSINIISEPGENQKAAEIVQAMWAKVGIQGTISTLESAAFKAAAQNNEHESAPYGGFPSPDPDGMARLVVCKGSANWGSYCNPEADKCMAEARVLYDEKQRAEIYKRCQRIMYEDAGVTGLVNVPWNAVYRKEVQNLKTNQHLVELREAWLDK